MLTGYGPRGAKKGRVFRLSERNGERRESRHRYRITERSEFGNAGGLAVGAQRRASIFRLRSAHRGKSFGIAADAEITKVLPGGYILSTSLTNLRKSSVLLLAPFNSINGIESILETSFAYSTSSF